MWTEAWLTKGTQLTADILTLWLLDGTQLPIGRANIGQKPAHCPVSEHARSISRKRPDTVGEPPLLVFNDPNRGSCVGATRRSAVDGAVEVPCRGLRLMIAFFRVKYYRKYFL